MFKKVLIAEDHEIRNLGVINTLEELFVPEFEFVSYCDAALKKVKSAITEEKPYDLLITDLEFDDDFVEQSINSGQELIAEVKKIQPNIKIIAFSIEKKTQLIDELFHGLGINGYVSKGRNDAKELKNTIKRVFADEIVIPQDILNSIRNNTIEVTDYDINLLDSLSKGWKQHEICAHFKQEGLQPNSRSAIEKRLNDLRDSLNARNNIEMIAICKDIGIL